MLMLILSVGLLFLAIVSLFLTLWVCRLPKFERLRPGAQLNTEDASSIAVIVPARNEAANIERCLRGLLGQTYPSERIQIVVVDDGSVDGTAAIVRKVAAADPRVHLMEAGPLAIGWTGKAQACWRGAQAIPSDWLCFVDADTAPDSTLLATTWSFARAKSIDMLSILPGQELRSFWERVLIPGATIGYALWMSVYRVNSPASSQAMACGAFILISREIYERIEGHAAVRQEVIEDLALACTVRRAGYRVYLARGEDLMSVRMYANLREIWTGVSKSALRSKRDIPVGILGSLVMLAGAWMPLLVPVWLWAAPASELSHSVLSIGILSLGFAITIGSSVVAMRALGVPAWYGLLYPLGSTVQAGVLLNAAWQRMRGQVHWRGRVYDLSSQEQHDPRKPVRLR